MKSCWKFCCTRLPQRWILGAMGSLAIMNAYTMRICLSLAITDMVIPTNKSTNGTISDDTCPAVESISSRSSSGGTYEWDEYTQGIILSSFFVGYIITTIPGGALAAKYGGKYVLGLGIFSTAVCTLLIPAVVQVFGATGLIVFRILMGFGEGTTFPAVFALVAQWAPPHERSKMTSTVLTGSQLGTILGTALSGVLIQHSSTGWPMAFYVFGALGILWFLAWLILCYSHPDVHPFITEKEKNYLHETMHEHTHRETQPIPWRHMLTSVPLWALLAGKFGRAWGFQMMVADLPKYMSNVLRFSIQANGFLSAIPHVAMAVAAIGSSWLADSLVKRGQLSTTNVRKMFTTISFLGSAIFIVLASYAECHHKIVVVLFTASMSMMGLAYSGVMANILDLSPNHSGILMSVSNLAGSLVGILVPYIVGILTPNQTFLEWRIVFWITFAVSCVTTLIFDLWADGEVQYWNNLDSGDDKTKDIELTEGTPFIECTSPATQTSPQHLD